MKAEKCGRAFPPQILTLSFTSWLYCTVGSGVVIRGRISFIFVPGIPHTVRGKLSSAKEQKTKKFFFPPLSEIFVERYENESSGEKKQNAKLSMPVFAKKKGKKNF